MMINVQLRDRQIRIRFGPQNRLNVGDARGFRVCAKLADHLGLYVVCVDFARWSYALCDLQAEVACARAYVPNHHAGPQMKLFKSPSVFSSLSRRRPV